MPRSSGDLAEARSNSQAERTFWPKYLQITFFRGLEYDLYRVFQNRRSSFMSYLQIIKTFLCVKM